METELISNLSELFSTLFTLNPELTYDFESAMQSHFLLKAFEMGSDWLSYIGALFFHTYYNSSDFITALVMLTRDSFSDALNKSSLIIGGLRPVEIKLPDNYDPKVPAPLLVLLHGYSNSGPWTSNYFGT